MNNWNYIINLGVFVIQQSQDAKYLKIVTSKYGIFITQDYTINIEYFFGKNEIICIEMENANQYFVDVQAIINRSSYTITDSIINSKVDHLLEMQKFS